MSQAAKTTEFPSRLDAQETTGVSLDPSDYRSRRIHPVAAEYEAARELYSHLDETSGKNRMATLERCRTFAWFVRDLHTGLVHVASNSCKLRWCPVCARAKTSFVSSQVLEWTRSLKHVRFLTLTLKSSSSPLSDKISFLYESFRKLRKYKYFKKLVTGGIWFFQVTYNKDTGYWHPHLHCLISGFYLPKDWLVKAWTKITKGSFICDIKSVKNQDKVSNYVARYVSQPVVLTSFPLAQRVSIFNAFHGRRLSGTWGKARIVSLSPRLSLAEKRFVKLGTWQTVYQGRNSILDAKLIYKAWLEKTVISPDVTVMPFEQFIDDDFEGIEIDEKRLPRYDPQFW